MIALVVDFYANTVFVFCHGASLSCPEKLFLIEDCVHIAEKLFDAATNIGAFLPQ
jgi:hypothetical protein